MGPQEMTKEQSIHINFCSKLQPSIKPGVIFAQFTAGNKSPSIKILLNDIPAVGVIDTGSSAHLLATSRLMKIVMPTYKSRIIKESGPKYRDAQNSLLPIVGTVKNVKLQIGKFICIEPITVYENNHSQELLIGFPYLKGHDISISSEGLSFNQDYRILRVTTEINEEDNDKKENPVYSKTGIFIKSGASMPVECCIKKPEELECSTLCVSSIYLEEEIEASKLSVYFQYIHIGPSGKFKVVITNFSPELKIIEEGELIGHAEPVMFVNGEYVFKRAQNNKIFKDILDSITIHQKLIKSQKKKNGNQNKLEKSENIHRILKFAEKDENNTIQEINDRMSNLELKFPEDVQITNEMINCQSEDPKHIRIIRNLVHRNKRICSKNPWDVKHAQGTEIDFPIKQDARPFRHREIPVPYRMKNAANELIQRLLTLNLIRPSNSAWSSRILFLQKGGEEKSTRKHDDIAMQKGATGKETNEQLAMSRIRVVFDYRECNDQIKDSYVAQNLPEIPQLLQSLRNTRYLGTVDICQAFWTLKISKRSSELCAFSYENQIYEPASLPQGVKCSPHFYQHYLARIFQKEKLVFFENPTIDGAHSGILVYLDNILIHALSEASYITLLERFFTIASKYDLKIKLQKSHFFITNKCILFGFLLDLPNNSISPDPQKVRNIEAIPVPSTKRKIRAFCGACQYFAPCVDHLSALMGPLYKLASPKTKFTWTPECDRAFRMAKRELAILPRLFLINPSQPCWLVTDACVQQHSCFRLYQYSTKHQRLLPVGNYSHKLTAAESRYSQHQVELLSVIIFFVKHFNHLATTRINWLTDCRALIFASRARHINSVVARWWQLLSLQNIRVYALPASSPILMLSDLLTRTSDAVQITNMRLSKTNLDQIPILDFTGIPPFTVQQADHLCQAFNNWHATLIQKFPTEKAQKLYITNHLQNKNKNYIPNKKATDKPLKIHIVKQVPIREQHTGAQTTKSPMISLPPPKIAFNQEKMAILKLDNDSISEINWEEKEFSPQNYILSSEHLAGKLHQFFPHLRLSDLKEAQDKDEKLQSLIKNNKNQDVQQLAGVYCKTNQKSYNTYYKVLWPESLAYPLLAQLHEGDTMRHLGRRKLNASLKSWCVIRGLTSYFLQIIQNCTFCTFNNKIPLHRAKYKTKGGVSINYGPRDAIAIDILIVNKNWQLDILNIINPFTLFQVSIPLATPHSSEQIVAEVVTRYIRYFGKVKYIIKDNQKELTSQLFDSVIIALGAMPIKIAPLNSRSNSLVELANRYLTHSLAVMNQTKPLKKEYLGIYLALANLSYNALITNRTEYSPIFLQTGLEAPRTFRNPLPGLFKNISDKSAFFTHLRAFHELLFQVETKLHEKNEEKKQDAKEKQEYRPLKKGDFCLLQSLRGPGERKAGFKLRPKYNKDLYRVIKSGVVSALIAKYNVKGLVRKREFGQGDVDQITLRRVRYDFLKKIDHPDDFPKFPKSAIAKIAESMANMNPCNTGALLELVRPNKIENKESNEILNQFSKEPFMPKTAQKYLKNKNTLLERMKGNKKAEGKILAVNNEDTFYCTSEINIEDSQIQPFEWKKIKEKLNQSPNKPDHWTTNPKNNESAPPKEIPRTAKNASILAAALRKKGVGIEKATGVAHRWYCKQKSIDESSDWSSMDGNQMRKSLTQIMSQGPAMATQGISEEEENSLEANTDSEDEFLTPGKIYQEAQQEDQLQTPRSPDPFDPLNQTLIPEQLSFEDENSEEKSNESSEEEILFQLKPEVQERDATLQKVPNLTYRETIPVISPRRRQFISSQQESIQVITPRLVLKNPSRSQIPEIISASPKPKSNSSKAKTAKKTIKSKEENQSLPNQQPEQTSRKSERQSMAFVKK
jgi:hypothetical protein